MTSSIKVVEQSKIIVGTNRQIPLIMLQCHGGVPIYFNDNITCLCPSYLYGSRCEYQNQRISVTLKISAPQWRTPFTFVIYLFDDIHQIINSYHHIRYLSIRDCNIKFHFHLLYSSRPKSSDKTYSVRIHAFEMGSLKYRGSWSFPILFSFLPVYRLPIYIIVPFIDISTEIDCPLKCQFGHGRCAIFLNTGHFFCLCESGWNGLLCTNSYKCDCSSDSICVGIWKNKSICICPTHKFGRRCYLKNNLCEHSISRKCQNGGECIPRDNRIITDHTTVCSCVEGFHGNECQQKETRIDIIISIPNIKDSLVIHFITVNAHMSSIPYIPTLKWGPHERATTYKRILYNRDIVTIYWSNPFHLVFAEYDHNMYLLIKQLKYLEGKWHNTTIESRIRCPSIQELLNSTIINFPRLRRVKYYHIPCQKRFDLECFHDEDQYICLCTHDHRANCFTFDHYMKYSCQQISYCLNGGQCFQDSVKCPTAALCACPKCYLGSRCQLSTRGFGLPLDVILGYQIQPEFSFNDQPLSVKISGIVTIIMFILGIINGIFSIITFKQRTLRQVGTGTYLLIVSIISILTITIFTLKYILLVITQLMMIKNRQFLLSQCIIIDFFLKIFMQIGDWLYACIAIERLISIIQGVNFNKNLSQKMVKWIVFIVFIVVIGSSIQEPLNRTLINDDDEGRIWCIVSYSKSYSNFLNLFTSITTIIHFISPFIINIISAFGIIIISAKSRSNVKKNISFNTHIRKQFRQHKYLIISPIGLIILALPRIILAFKLECMKSPRESVTFFLIAYFISFLPPLFLFIVFVLPSSTYRKTFMDNITAIWNKFYH